MESGAPFQLIDLLLKHDVPFRSIGQHVAWLKREQLGDYRRPCSRRIRSLQSASSSPRRGTGSAR